MLTERDIQARDALEAAMHAGGEDNRFWAVRAMAIQSYALFEQALGDLFAGLSDTNPIVAGIIFFRLNASTRSPILEKLFRHKFHSQYNLFRNSLIKALRPLEGERNEIVHWNVTNQITPNDDGTMTGTLYLEAPSLWTPDENVRRWGIDDLRAFQPKCAFFAGVVRMFSSIVIYRREFYGFPPNFSDAWRDIFQQPLVYPPPTDHPLCARLQRPDTPPPPSPP
jgi:hypothetical protein